MFSSPRTECQTRLVRPSRSSHGRQYGIVVFNVESTEESRPPSDHQEIVLQTNPERRTIQRESCSGAVPSESISAPNSGLNKALKRRGVLGRPTRHTCVLMLQMVLKQVPPKPGRAPPTRKAVPSKRQRVPSKQQVSPVYQQLMTLERQRLLLDQQRVQAQHNKVNAAHRLEVCRELLLQASYAAALRETQRCQAGRHRVDKAVDEFWDIYRHIQRDKVSLSR